MKLKFSSRGVKFLQEKFVRIQKTTKTNCEDQAISSAYKSRSRKRDESISSMSATEVRPHDCSHVMLGLLKIPLDRRKSEKGPLKNMFIARMVV